METAAVRIKFTPLLKKINCSDSESNCCIEIVPELSGYQHLDKINWKLEEKFVEYKIPMTYKIIIKKQDVLKTETNGKMYHSCVDLLQPCSVSNSDFASGDVTRIISDNVFLPYKPKHDACDIVMTRDLFSPRELENIIKRQTASIQTVEYYDPCYSSLSSQRATIDKSQETGITCKPTVSTVAVNCDDVMCIQTGNKKQCDSKLTVALTSPDITKSTNDNETAANNDNYELDEIPLEAFTNNHLQNRLSLSPICSINTYDILPTDKVYTKSNASSYVLCDSFSKTNIHSDDSNAFNVTEFGNVHENGYFNKEVVDVPFSKSRQIFHILASKTNLTIKNILDEDITEDKSAIFIQPHKEISAKEYSLPITISTPPPFKIRNFKKFENIMEPRYERAIPNINNSKSVVHRTTKCKMYNRNIEPQGAFIVEKCNIPRSPKICTENRRMLLVNDSRRESERVLPSVRIAMFVQNLEREIHPLKMKLQEIKSKCLRMGLFCNEQNPMKKNVFYKSVPLPKIDNCYYNIKTETCKAKKSNRVVYTILFNG